MPLYLEDVQLQQQQAVPQNDSDQDGDNRNDVDATTPTVLLPTNKSGLMLGSLTISDADGATDYQPFEIEVSTRTFEVEWKTEEVEINREGYLEQGSTWEEVINPGSKGRIIAFYAVLELAQEIGPPDNFTLELQIPTDGYKKSAKTEGGNLTANETSRAELEREAINPLGEDGTYSADSREEVLALLLNKPGERTAQGDWIWKILAEQADPDPPENCPAPTLCFDPDPGNDWSLEVIIIIQTPELTEIAV